MTRPTETRPLWLRFAVAILAVAIAAAIRAGLNPWLGQALPFQTMYGAVAVAVWFGGWEAGAFATISGFLVANYLFIPSRGVLTFGAVEIWIWLIGYALSCGLIIGLGEAMRRAQVRAESEAKQRRSTEAILRAHESELQQVIDSTPFMLSRCSRDLRFLFISQAYATMLGRAPAEIAGKPIREVMGEKGFAAIAPHVEKVLRGEHVEYERDIEFEGVGSRRLHVAYTPDRNASGEVTAWFASIVDMTEREIAQGALRQSAQQQEALYHLANALQQTQSSSEIYEAAINSVIGGLGCDRASILMFDGGGVMRFVASRGLSEEYRRSVEGHSPWTPETKDAQPIAIENIETADLDDALKTTILNEGIRACAFIPLASDGRVVGKFMAYFDAPHLFAATELETGLTIGRQLAFAVDRQRAEEDLRRGEERLRIATSTGKVGAWEWDVTANRISWSDSLYLMHGVDKASFGGTVEDFEKLIHPDDQDRVAEAIQRSVKDAMPYELTFRAVKPSGETVWLFTNAVVVREADQKIRMIGATADVTELKQVQEALQAAKAAADEANRAKDQFLAMLSHELRTPLTPVLMAATALAEDETLSPTAREQLTMMRRNIELEARLIDDLLDITRIAHGKLELQTELIDVHAALDHALNISASGINEKQLHLTKRFGATAHYCEADAARLQEVFWNILRNAVKFTPANGKIALTTRNEYQQIVVEISDNGIGIEPSIQPRIFEAFAQAEPAVRARLGGLGLGLAISKRIIDLHNGTIGVRSSGHNHGSTFTIRLAQSHQSRLSPPAPAVPDSGRTAAGRILIVEDHEDTVQVLTKIMRSAGYTITPCGSVAEARIAVAGQQFDLVISDIGLPDGTGLDLMRYLRDKHRLRGIALSGFGSAADLEQSKAAGFEIHLTKPVDVARLRSAVVNMLNVPAPAVPLTPVAKLTSR